MQGIEATLTYKASMGCLTRPGYAALQVHIQEPANYLNLSGERLDGHYFLLTCLLVID